MKLLIGVVTSGKHRYCLDQVQLSVEKQSQKADSLFVVPKGESAYATLLKSRKLNAVEDLNFASSDADKAMRARKFIRKHALDNGYDAVLFIEGDIVVPGRGLEFLQSTLGDVIAGAYLNVFEIDGKQTIAPVLYRDEGNGNAKQLTYEGAAVPKVMQIGAAGFGCVLVRRKALEAIDFRAMNEKGNDSIAFFVDARAKGFSCLANTGVHCLHLVYPITDERARLFEWRKKVADTSQDLHL